MTNARKLVLTAAGALFGVWLIGNVPRIVQADEGLIRFVLGLLFAVLILLRWKPADRGFKCPAWILAAAGAGGALLSVLGIVFHVHQFEWLGLILLLYACLGWSLPPRFGIDLVLALLLLYWVHPLPGQVFGYFQLTMQRLSLVISEWLLHVLNVRVWGDQMVLYSAGGTFGVPESCSGMRAAVTVLLCTLGTGILLRLRWYEIAVFVLVGIVQVLALNVIRIASMVIWAPRMPADWAETFLHDTLGVFLLASIVLIQAEMAIWKFWVDKRRRLKEGIRSGEFEPPDLGTVLPGFWRRVVRWGWRIAAVVLLAALVAFALYKSRTEHRIAMLRGTVSSLATARPEVAERAIQRVLEHDPGDREMRTTLVRVLLTRDKHEDALQALGRIEGELSTVEVVWKGWALVALDRMDEAIAVVETLPEETKRLPGVAIIRAEFAARQDEPEDVSRNVVAAAVWPALAERVRNLFPYLSAREQWWAIAECNMQVPFSRIEHAVLAIVANLRARNVLGAEQNLRLALEQWPLDARLLPYLGWVALNRRDREWEDRLAANFTANLMELTPDVLADHLGTCFQLQRPDLAWQAYLRLHEVDPRDPALALAVAQFGEAWFRFRRRDLALSAEDGGGTIDLAALCRATAPLAPLASFWRTVPLRDELLEATPTDIRAEYLARCLSELELRQRQGELNFRMHIMYPFVLALAGRHDEAHRMLDRILEQWPEREAIVRRRHATLYVQEQEWAKAYEALRRYEAVAEEPELNTSLLKIQTMMNLNMGVCAMEQVRRARGLFPRSERLTLAEVAIWDVFGFKEQALFLLRKAELEAETRVTPQLLYQTGRIEQAVQAGKATGVRIAGYDRRAPVPWDYPPAERAVARRFPPPRASGERARQADIAAQRSREVASPFHRELAARTAAWFRNGAAGDADVLPAWRELGRDSFERATALHRLALLAGQAERNSLAVEAGREAVALMPESAILRRLLIGLTEGDPAVVAQAARACPDDPVIWLASLVTRDDDDAAWRERVAAEIERATREEAIPVATLVRAANFALRNGMVEAAAAAARYCVAQEQGLLPAYVAALRCALAQRDWNWALDMAIAGAKRAHDPTRFYQIVVDIKTAQQRQDGDLLSALKYMRGRFPEQTEWSERLGYFYFRERDMKRALSVFEPVVGERVGDVRPGSLLLSAEAARQQGRLDDALRILEAARAMHPEKTGVLNNLVYYLAMNPETVDQARRLLPELLAQEDESFEVLDTAAVVYLNSGELERAREYIDQALERLEEGTYSELETRLNAARVHFRLGNLDTARRLATEIRRAPDRTIVVERAVGRLLEEIERARQERESDPDPSL